jgi:uncharacterized protein
MTCASPRRAPLFYICLLAAAALGLPARAITLDEAARALQPQRRVYDFAGVLARQEQVRLNERLARMEAEGLAEGAVVVVDQVEGTTSHDFARNLGERWRVGRGGTANGFVLLISVRDKKGSLVTGTGLEGLLPDAAIYQLAQRTLAPALQEGRYGEGLEAMLAAVEERLQAAGGVDALPPATTAPGPPAPLAWLTFLLGATTAGMAFLAWPRGSTPGRDRYKWPAVLLGFGSLACAVLGASQAPAQSWGLIMVGLLPGAYAGARLLETAWIPVPLPTAGDVAARTAAFYWGSIALVVLFWIFAAPSWWLLGFVVLAVPFGLALRTYFRRVPRKCPQCGGALRWLPEKEEAEFLHEDENLEQALGTVDYDVWRCQGCNRSAIFSRAQVFGQHGVCPKCGRRTLTRRTVIEQAPSAWQDAWRSEVTECQNPRCGYHDVKQRRMEESGFGGFGGPGIIIIPPIFGGGWGGHGGHHEAGGHGEPGGGDLGGPEVGDFGGSGDFGGGGADFDW